MVTYVPDCQACGTCCQPPCPVSVTFKNREDEPELLQPHVQFLWGPQRGFVLGTKKLPRCPYLEDQDGRFSCSIYDHKPAACTKFQPGSHTCHQLRRDAGRDDP